MSNYLLDTNAAIARINGNQDIIKLLETANTIAIPIITVGELFYGAEHSAQVVTNLQQVEAFISGRTIIECDVETARWYGRITQWQSAKGRRIPDNDTWIAAIALQHSFTLLTRDKHFETVDGLLVQSW